MANRWYYGPVIEKYIEAVELTESGGGIVIDSALEAEKVFDRLLVVTTSGKRWGRLPGICTFQKRGNGADPFVYL